MAARTRGAGAGRPPRYTDAEEMRAKIDAYFEACEGEPVIDEETGKPIVDKHGQIIYRDRRPPTVTGLALALGFTSRQSLLNYEARDRRFARVLQIAKSRIEQYAEERLYDRDGCLGARFNLQYNYGWAADPRGGGQDVEDLTPLATLLGLDARGR